jgi:hypothetical protein
MAAPRKQFSRDRLDRLLLNADLSRALLKDLGYSETHPKARALSSAGWPAFLASHNTTRSAALYVAPNGRICRVEGSSIRTLGGIDLYREHRGAAFPDAVLELEATYLGLYPLSGSDLDRNRRMPLERHLAAETLANQRSADGTANDGEDPDLQPGARDKLDPIQALKAARRRFAAAVPEEGQGYLHRHRMISPTVIRRFGADRGPWAVLRYDTARDEMMAAHTDSDGRFVGYEYRGGRTPSNPRGSRGYASRCAVGFGILGEPTTAQRLVLCESVIEALSLIDLETERDPDLFGKSAWLSCAGGPKHQQLERVIGWAKASPSPVVVTAFNSDDAGNAFRAAVRRVLEEAGIPPGQLQDLRPTANDWNDTLKASRATGIRREDG